MRKRKERNILTIRHATREDVEAMARIEGESYPPAEAASRESIAKRVETFPECFWIWEEEGEILAFINGMATNERDLRDEMYERAELHDPRGAWLMLFSVVTGPGRRHQGRASALMRRVLEESREKREGVVLTCKEELLGFYGRFGFVSEGVSASAHGGSVWYQMRLKFR